MILRVLKAIASLLFLSGAVGAYLRFQATNDSNWLYFGIGGLLVALLVAAWPIKVNNVN